MQRKPALYKQVIAVRKDLAMDAGKLGVQTAHATKLALLGDVRVQGDAPVRDALTFQLQGAAAYWLQTDFTTILVEVNSEAELRALLVRAQAEYLPAGLVVDNGWTVFGNKKTATCVAIGPGPSEAIDVITGHLPLYKGD